MYNNVQVSTYNDNIKPCVDWGGEMRKPAIKALAIVALIATAGVTAGAGAGAGTDIGTGTDTSTGTGTPSQAHRQQ